MRDFTEGIKLGVHIAGAVIGFQLVYIPIIGVAKGLSKMFKEGKNDQKDTNDGTGADMSE